MPNKWAFCRLISVANIYTGNSINERIKETKYVGLSSGYNYIGTKDVGFNRNINYNNGVKIPFANETFKIAREGTTLLCIEGGSAGRKIGILKEDVCFGNKLSAFEAIEINRKYLYYYLQAPIFLSNFNRSTSGIIGGVGINRMKSFILLVPPLAEQSRIVERLEKLEPLIEKYDALEKQATKLDSEIKDKLRKSILQYAIQGKLVPQDKNDEPASMLLERIRKEKKARLGKKYVESYIYKGDDNCYYEHVKSDSINIDDQLPFDLPNNWSWSRLRDVVYNHGQKTPKNTFCYIDIGSIDNKNQKLNAIDKIIKPENAPSRARKIVKKGDIIYSTVRPYLHNACIIDRDFLYEPIASSGFAVLSVKPGIYNDFLFKYLLSSSFDSYANNAENSKGVAYPAINDTRLYQAVIPIPPIKEQYRIADKVNKIFSLLGE
ncbi:MAG: restriction endonuclease subunit S [Christensenellales bacterium]